VDASNVDLYVAVLFEYLEAVVDVAAPRVGDLVWMIVVTESKIDALDTHF